MTDTTQPPAETLVRISREQFPEIIQAARWMDEDNGTLHFEPGVGFIIDDPDGLSVPVRWIEHLPTIEAALTGLDHVRPHPDDVDTLEWLAREGKEPTVYESAVHCFVSGEHTPVTIMARSSRDLYLANRFLNERFEGWSFDPAADFEDLTSRAGGDAIPAGALPQHIGRVHLGERRSDGERLCSHGHEVPAGHPLYWPDQISQYDDSDPLCLAHAIEQSESDNADWDTTSKPPAGGDAIPAGEVRKVAFYYELGHDIRPGESLPDRDRRIYEQGRHDALNDEPEPFI